MIRIEVALGDSALPAVACFLVAAVYGSAAARGASIAKTEPFPGGRADIYFVMQEVAKTLDDR